MNCKMLPIIMIVAFLLFSLPIETMMQEIIHPVFVNRSGNLFLKPDKDYKGTEVLQNTNTKEFHPLNLMEENILDEEKFDSKELRVLMLCNDEICNDTFENEIFPDKMIFKRDVETTTEQDYLVNDTYDNGNFSKEEYLNDIRQFIFPKSWTWVLIFFHFVVFVIGLVGNTLVCVAVYRNHTMRTVTNYFIVNLAIADFLVILFCLPPSVVWDVTMTWFFGLAMCKIVLYLQNLKGNEISNVSEITNIQSKAKSVSVTVSVLTLTFISIDRWYAICFPLRFKSTTGRAKTAIGIIWLFALLFDIPEAVHSETYPNEDLLVETIYFTQCAVSWSKDTDRVFVSIKLILLYALPLVFMTIAYVQIIRVLWKSGNATHQTFGDVTSGRHVNTFAMNMNTSTEGQLRSRRKAAKMLVAVVVMFAFCYFPVHLLSVLRLTVDMKNTEINRAYALISHWLCYANSAVNPIIYNFMSGKFRKEFCRAFEECCQTAGAGQGYQLNAMNRNHTENDSGIASSHSSRRNETDVRRLNTINDSYFETRHNRRGTKTSMLRMDI